MFCDKCGKELAPGSIFCPDCGAKQSEDSAAPETASQSVQQENPKVEAVEAETRRPSAFMSTWAL